MIAKRQQRLRCAAFAAGVAIAAAAGLARADADSGGIAVTAIDAETRRPLAGVRVTAVTRDGAAQETATLADGGAAFGDLAPGLYELTAAAADRAVAVEPSVRVIARRTTPVRFELQPLPAAIDEVVVTARARQADRYGAVGNGFYNRDELRNAVGAGSDVMRALDGLPGLVSTGDFANFSVRGRGPRNNLIFVDGFPFDKVVHFDQTLGEEEDIGGGGRFSIFAPNSITGAEFSPGGWSAAYGGRSGSLLKLDVAGGTPTPSASLRIDIAGAEFGYEGPSGLHDDTTLFVTARSFDFGRVFERIDEKDIGQPELTDVIVKTVTELDADNQLEFLAIAAPEEYTRDIDNVLASPDFEDVSLITAEQDLGLAGLTWRRLVGDNGEWTNRLYLRDSDKTSTEGEAFPDLVPDGTPGPDVPVEERLITIREQEREIGWRSDFTTRNRFGPFATGLRIVQTDADFSTDLRQDWIRYVYEDSDPRPPGQNYIVWRPDEINSVFDASETSYSAFAEQVFEIGALDIRTGLRYDRDGFADESLLSPRLAANYQVSPVLRLSATAGLYYESPRYLVRAANPDNAGLSNERITHLSAGFERRFGETWQLLVEGYYQRLDDLIVDEGRATGRAANDGDGRNTGADVVLTRAFDNGWSANATYSYNRSRLNDNDGRGDYTADFSRDHFFSIGARWEISERWQVAARWKYGSGRPGDAFGVNADVLGPGEPLRFSKEITDPNAITLDDYHSLNLRVDYRRPVGPVDLVAFVDVINVYGGSNGNPPEFNPRRGVDVEEEDEAFPIIGLIFERSW
ncbi:MAG: carboxypeptidase regulatory-like domain-containing protein [Pseudomonadota bacterium]